MKTIRLLMIAFLCVGIASVADAKTKRHHRHHKGKKKSTVVSAAAANGLTFVETRDVQPDDEATTESVARDVFNDPDIVDCFRASSTGTFVVDGVGTFSITQDPLTSSGPTYTITWALDAGMLLEGLYIKGGSNGNFYSAGDTQAGSGDAHAPVAGGSGMFASLSHVDFFCDQGETPPPTVPDGGSAVALLGLALGGLEGVRRMIRARQA
jgi:hypothetical protein